VLYGGAAASPAGSRTATGLWAAKTAAGRWQAWDFRHSGRQQALLPARAAAEGGTFTTSPFDRGRWISTTWRAEAQADAGELNHSQVRSRMISGRGWTPKTPRSRSTTCGTSPWWASRRWTPARHAHLLETPPGIRGRVWGAEVRRVELCARDDGAGRGISTAPRQGGYRPLPGEDMRKAEALAPTMDVIVRVDAPRRRRVRGVTLRGLTCRSRTRR